METRGRYLERRQVGTLFQLLHALNDVRNWHLADIACLRSAKGDHSRLSRFADNRRYLRAIRGRWPLVGRVAVDVIIAVALHDTAVCCFPSAI